MTDMPSVEISSQQLGQSFEQEVYDFFNSIGFTKVNGGSNFFIGDYQIDACGVYGKTLFVVECKSTQRRSKASLRTEILAWREKVRYLQSKIGKIPQYEDCIEIYPLFATQKYDIRSVDLALLLEHAEIPIFHISDEFIEYYLDLIDKIGKYAIYNLLGDLRVRLADSDQFQTIAMYQKINEYGAFLFFADPKSLLKVSYVARRWKGKEDHYQRLLEKSRIKKIGKFVDQKGIFPTNIVLSIRGKYKKDYHFWPTNRTNFESAGSHPIIGTLQSSGSYGIFWIVDGQHRLYSFAKSHNSTLVPCIALPELTAEQERSFFLDINREQKPISIDLLWDLEGQADPGCLSEKGLISNVVKMINSPPPIFHELVDNPFQGKIYIPVMGSKENKSITITSLCNAISNSGITDKITSNCLGIENPLYSDIRSTQRNRTANSLSHYFKLIDESITDEEKKHFLLGNAGIAILLYLFEPILARISRIPRRAELSPYVSAIKKYFDLISDDQLDEIKRSSNSEGARKDLSQKIGIFIRSELRDPDFWKTMSSFTIADDINEIERSLGILIAMKLNSADSDWQKRRVPQDISRDIKRKMEADGRSFDDCLGLGQELSIIFQENNWSEVFSRIFTPRFFRNKEEFSTAISILGRCRAPIAHGASSSTQSEDIELGKAYLKKFRRLLVDQGVLL